MPVPSDHRAAPYLTRLLAAAIVGDDGAATELLAFDVDEVCREAEVHGVGPLLVEALAGYDGALRRALARRAVALSAVDILREAELRRLLAAFTAASVPMVLIKGAALAYTHYARSDLRPRLDTDVLIPADAQARAEAVLAAAGYTLQPQITADLVMYQAAYAKGLGGDARHLIDLHWRIANPQSFGGVLTFEELAASALPVPALDAAARSLDDVRALVLSCVHRVAHHRDAPNLIWIHDIHLEASRLDNPSWERFLVLAHDRDIGAVCRRSLEMAGQLFHTSIPSAVMSDPRLAGELTMRAPTAAHLDHRRHVSTVLDDFKQLPGWRQRLRLARQHLLPPAAYMREVYAPASRAPLAFLYTIRAVKGARRWLART
ncbi:MAG TPA: nucleotidyltransferase family protein [Vicinamibacterales bacterium]|nr:nucleotidyltransferase family protein [Vicinamibacterales bacterium]